MTDDLNFDPATDFSTEFSEKRWIGVSLSAPVKEVSVFSEKPLSGPVVLEVVPTGPAHKAGVKVGDMIVQLNHSPVFTPESFIERLQEHPIGDVIILGINRDNHVIQLKVIIDSDPDHQRLLDE